MDGHFAYDIVELGAMDSQVAYDFIDFEAKNGHFAHELVGFGRVVTRAILGPSWGILGHLGGHLGTSWGHLGLQNRQVTGHKKALVCDRLNGAKLGHRNAQNSLKRVQVGPQKNPG